MSGDSMLQKIRDEFFGNTLTMIDFLGQFELMAGKYFEPGRIYDLYRLCLVKRKVLDGGEREVLQFLNDRLEVIEEITLGRRSSEQLAVNEFLSTGDSEGAGGEPDVSPLMQDFFDRVISVSSTESITRRTGGLSKILLDGETRTETYKDRPDIPLFEESEDGFQKVHPVSNAFKEDDTIPVLTPFSEEPDLFSELGLHPEKEEEREKKESVPINEEPEVIFTHSSIVIDDSDTDDEDEYTIFEGGIKVTPPEEEEVPVPEKEEESVEEFLGSLVDETPEAEAEEETEAVFETEAIPEEMSVPEEELPVADLPAYEPVPGSDHFEVVDEIPGEPAETEEEPVEEDEVYPQIEEEPVDTEETFPETEEEPIEVEETSAEAEEEPVENAGELSETIETTEESVETAEDFAETPAFTEPEPEPEPPHRRQRISIFDDFEEEPGETPANEQAVEAEEAVLEEDIPGGSVTEEPEPDPVEEPEEENEPDSIPVEEPEDHPEDAGSVEIAAEEELEPEPQVAEEETIPEPEPYLITEEDLEIPIEEESVAEKIAAEKIAMEEVNEEIEPAVEKPAEEETPVVTGLLFDEDFFDDTVDLEPKEETAEKAGTVEGSELSVAADPEPEEPVESEPEEVFHHISRESIISPDAEPEEKAAPAEHYAPVQETEYQKPEETKAGINEEEQAMGGQKEEKSTFSVLGKMLLVLGLMIATWYILDSSGLLKGKTASLDKVDLAKGAVLITDSNSLADKRDYPFNRDTQNDPNLLGLVFKNGKYFEVAENGVLTPVDYDTSSKKKIKVTVPPDSLLALDTKKDKKEEAKGKGKEKEKGKETEKDKAAKSGNITLQDAVKNKVKENKIADHVFKSGKKFFVQVSAHRSFETAEKIALDLKKKGYSSFVMKVKKEGVRGEDGVWYRVRIGPYDKEAKALEVNKVFNKNKKS